MVSSFNRKSKKRLQIPQNKCIRLRLNLGNRDSIDLTRFRQINWLPVKERVNQCVCTLIYKFLNNKVPEYIEDIIKVKERKYNTRNPNMLIRPFCPTNKGQYHTWALSYGKKYRKI